MLTILVAYRKINTSPSTIDEKEILKLHLTTPPIKKIDLHFPLGLNVTARNLKGVTIKDAMDAIHKSYKKKVFAPSVPATCAHTAIIPLNLRTWGLTLPLYQADDELDLAYLKGFEYDIEEDKTRFVVHLTSTPAVEASSGGGKKKKNKKNEE